MQGDLSSPVRSAYLSSLILIAAGLLLAAVQILPTVELLRNSMRADASYDFFTSFSLPRRFLWTFFAPYVVGGGDGNLFRAPYVGPAFYAEYVGYVGLLTIALAIVGLMLKRDARTKFWVGVVCAGLALALGRYAPFSFYKLIYVVPVLNLFRVPARHLMEVEFALAVLAGRGLTAVMAAKDRNRTVRRVLLAGLVVFVMTCMAVTVGRPGNLHLGRSGPVSILRAPELFLPIIMAALSVAALWFYAKGQRRALGFLLAVLALDLCVWGQSSGWRAGSPRSDFELWGKPVTVQVLQSQPGSVRTPTSRGSDRVVAKVGDGPLANGSAEPYRILTQDVVFDPNQSSSTIAALPPGAPWIPSLQPDVHMLYGIENAAGYDGFGLARYSRLAGHMKVWGDLTDPQSTLGGGSRELDLLNVRYLLARSPPAAGAGKAVSAEFPAASVVYGGQSFAPENLNVPSLGAGERLSFKMPPTEVNHLALVTNLAWSDVVPNRTVVAQISLRAEDGRTFSFELRAGDHTAEWSHDRPDIRTSIRHQRAPLATSYEVADGQIKYEAHTYVSSFDLPRRTVIMGGEITVARIPAAPQLSLSVSRLTLADGARAFPIRSEWLQREAAADTDQPATDKESPAPPRWQRVAETGPVAIFENTRRLPRAWLAPSELVATDEQELAVIRSGKLPGGAPWDPLSVALVESGTGLNSTGTEPLAGESRRADVLVNEPNRVEVETEASAPSLLVLSANHYPGWRAFVDEHPTAVVRVNYDLRGVALPAGKHLVRFVYQPKSVLAGLLISLLTLVGLFWLSRAR